MKKLIYLASPFFNDEEIENIERAEQILERRGDIELWSPRKKEDRTAQRDEAWSLATFVNDKKVLDACSAVVMLYYGNYSDSGTAWECGYAYAAGKPVVVVHINGTDAPSNLMVHEGSHANITLEQLGEYDFETMPFSRYHGKMI